MIQAPDESLLPKVMQWLMFKEQMNARKEHQKLEQADLKLRQEKMAMEQAQQQQQQMPALMNFLQAAHDPATADLTQPAMQMLGNAQVSNPTLMGAVNAVAAPQQMGGRAMPSQIDQRREELKFDKMMKQLRQHMTEQEFSQFQAGVSLVQQGVPKEMVDWAIPETLKETADRLKVLAEAEEIKDRNQSNEFAQAHLAEKYGIVVGTDKANETLRSLVLADRAAAQARSLKAMELEGTKKNVLIQAENQLRDNFEKSPVVKSAQAVTESYGRVVQLAARAAADKNGAADQALIFQFVNMQDNTAARDAERAAIIKSGSLENYITARFGKWTAGEVLADEVRQKIVKAAEDMLASTGASLDAYMQHYGKIAAGSGIDPARIMYNPITEPKSRSEDAAAKIRVRAVRGK